MGNVMKNLQNYFTALEFKKWINPIICFHFDLIAIRSKEIQQPLVKYICGCTQFIVTCFIPNYRHYMKNKIWLKLTENNWDVVS